jgi:hypothetical protein
MYDHLATPDPVNDRVKACDRCDHPAWTHGIGAICTECDNSRHGGACGLLSLYGFDINALPLDDLVPA